MHLYRIYYLLITMHDFAGLKKNDIHLFLFLSRNKGCVSMTKAEVNLIQRDVTMSTALATLYRYLHSTANNSERGKVPV